MLQEEVIDIITDELVDFLDNYILMTSFSHEALKSKIEPKKSIEFGDYYKHHYNGNIYFNAKHYIHKAGRTKLNFHFSFHKDELRYVIQLNRLLDGYVDYGITNSSHYKYYFTLDVGSKANYMKFFNRLWIVNEEEDE